MDLEQSIIHRNLDTKLKVLGLEAPDLLIVLILAAVMNLFFGDTSLVLPLVFGLPLLLLISIYVGKKGKPESYLLHLAHYIATPSYYSAGKWAKYESQLKKTIYE